MDRLDPRRTRRTARFATRTGRRRCSCRANTCSAKIALWNVRQSCVCYFSDYSCSTCHVCPISLLVLSERGPALPSSQPLEFHSLRAYPFLSLYLSLPFTFFTRRVSLLRANNSNPILYRIPPPLVARGVLFLMQRQPMPITRPRPHSLPLAHRARQGEDVSAVPRAGTVRADAAQLGVARLRARRNILRAGEERRQKKQSYIQTYFY
jgi:hypothetical protein